MEGEKKNKIELHSEPMQEILGTPPRWIIRIGITVILAVVALFLVGSRFIKYQEIFKATITVIEKEVAKDHSSNKRDNDKSYFGKIILPRKRAGKVRAGQKVNLKFEEYPYLEYGFTQILLSQDSMDSCEDPYIGKAYMLEVELPDSLMTQYKKHIPYRHGMSGAAEIVTEDVTVFDRFLNPIRKILGRR